ncbi:PEP-CTERM sorting domain-containing protein [Methylophilus sp. 'Pure River']|uniref:PEP-CTERM sorting domain-containing protein n=1 Tax=Methylophilus sp. 'Pure River' TaxID=3377117 RepID=UPI00398EEA8B
MYKFKSFLIVLAMAVSLVKTVNAATVTIDFESLKQNDIGYTFIAGPYVDSGYTFTASNPVPYSFASAGAFDPRFAGSTALTTFNSGMVFVENNTGTSFDFLSVDLAPVTLGLNDPFGVDREVGVPYQTTIYGLKVDGTIVSQVITLPNSSAENILTAYSLVGFTGLTQFAIDSSAFPGVQFDNIVLQTVSGVPEPSVLSLVALGLLLMTLYSMRKSR